MVFSRRWRALPPPDPRLLYGEKSREAQAILAGHWELVPIFPWTTQNQLGGAFRRVRRFNRKQARTANDYRRRAIMAWLHDHGHFVHGDWRDYLHFGRAKYNRGLLGDGGKASKEVERGKHQIESYDSPPTTRFGVAPRWAL